MRKFLRLGPFSLLDETTLVLQALIEHDYQRLMVETAIFEYAKRPPYTLVHWQVKTAVRNGVIQTLIWYILAEVEIEGPP